MVAGVQTCEVCGIRRGATVAVCHECGHAADVPGSAVAALDALDEVLDAANGKMPAVQIPKGNASQGEWASFARANGYPGDPDQESRNTLRDWYHGVHGGGDQERDHPGTGEPMTPVEGDTLDPGQEADDATPDG